MSTTKSQHQTITSIQWLPPWCRIDSDGNFQQTAIDSPKEQRACLATSSTDGSIFFWSLPRCLSTPARVRSPLQLVISPVYRLLIADPGDKAQSRPLPLSCLSLPLARSAEQSSLSIRDRSDLARLRRLFVGTSAGEVLCCTWDGRDLAVDEAEPEVCRIRARCCAHDGAVRTMAKSPHLDDVFLTVGGRSFALWKEDLTEVPVFRSSSTGQRYGEGCWSGRSGVFVLTRLDGCFEVWDLKRRAHEPVLLQTLSGKVGYFDALDDEGARGIVDLGILRDDA